ncbi:C-GCAxxG-C-C family protein [Beduini massiliensis]|uniref:C-GCAxxG-C-C family protein n=1 Tax=Beduini massiliensis TaxID=1585974 RepID=UPI00356289FC
MNNRHQQDAKHLHENGYNCAQAFLCTYKNELSIDEKTLFQFAEGLGRGVAGLEEMCCIPIIMAMIISYLETSDANLEAPKSKLKSYACAKCLAMDFKEKIGSLKCQEILEENKKRSDRCCTDVIQLGIKILDECLREEN